MSKKDKCKLEYKCDYPKHDDHKHHDEYKKMYQQMHEMMGHMYCGLCKSLHHTVFAMMQQMCMSPMMMHPQQPAMHDMCMTPCMPMPMMPTCPTMPTHTAPEATEPTEVVTKPDDFFFHVNMPEIPPSLCLPGVELEEKKKMG